MKGKSYIPVNTPLGDYVTVIWETLGSPQSREVILPRGIVEMVFNLGDEMLGILPGSGQFRPPACFIQGLNTVNLDVDYAGRHHLFGIRLQPAMVQGLLGILPSEVKNSILDLTLVRAGFDLLWQQLKEAGSFEARVKLVEEQLRVKEPAICVRTQRLCGLFLADGMEHFQDTTSLSQQVCYSTRHLNRKTKAIFGMSAEELIVYKKFLQSVKLLHTQNGTLTSVAYDSGFFDQAHFCRVFKSYTGFTPREYRLQKSALPFHLYS